MSIPDPMNAATAREALEYFLAAGFDRIDTAILYQDGATEATLGECCFQFFVFCAHAIALLFRGR